MYAHTSEHPIHLSFGAGGTSGANMGEGIVDALQDAGIEASVDIVVPTGDSGSCSGEIATLHNLPSAGDARNVLGAVSGNAAGAAFKSDSKYGDTATVDTIKRDTDGLLEIIAGTGANMDRVHSIFTRAAELGSDLPNGLRGYTLGGLLLTALQLDLGSTSKAVAEASEWLRARARVIPVTDSRHDLVLWDAGKTVRGEDEIDRRDIVDPRHARLWLETEVDGPPPLATAAAIGSFTMADVVLFGHASLFTSTLAITGAGGVPEAVRAQGSRENPGALAALVNLTEDRNTTGLEVVDYLSIIQGALGRRFTHALYNREPGAVPAGKVPVRCDERDVLAMGVKPIAAKLVAAVAVQAHANDRIADLRSGVVTDMRGMVAGLKMHVLPEIAQREFVPAS
ncbi:MAG TPA: 2-phospho-L-lactate transferase CofD family protein [Patescibacteria group bacterium]|nr:2-phospho-L-lactate transferase CofD family protein [Patescibacteria group bacterium]